MNKYYFTFGSAGQLYIGGWIIIHARDYAEACHKFVAYYDKRSYVTSYKSGRLNFSFWYIESDFLSTGMAEKGNAGAFCHNEIA